MAAPRNAKTRDLVCNTIFNEENIAIDILSVYMQRNRLTVMAVDWESL